jgi:tetratricopeptide (TPR) repeat protein
MPTPLRLARFFFAALVASPTAARAQTLVPEPCVDYVSREQSRDAQLLAMRGVACFEAKQYARALSFYRRAQRINRDPLLDAAIGRAWDELGALDQASTHYRRFLRQAPAQDAEGRARIQERLRALDAELRQAATLSVEAWPSGAQVWLELPNAQREPLGQSPLQLRLRPGSYALLIERPEYYSQRHALSLSSGEQRTLDAELVSHNATFNVSSRGWRRAGLWTMAVGAPLLVGGVTLSLLGDKTLEHARDPLLDADETRRRELLDTGYSQQGWGLAMMCFGGAAVVTGAAFWLTGKLTEDEPNKPLSLTPMLAPHYAGFSLSW